MAEPEPRWRQLVAALGTVRLRATFGATLVVGIALLVAGVGLAVGLRGSLVNDRREVAEARADEIVALIEAAPDPSGITIPDVDDQWVQVIDANGNVVTASAKVAGLPAIVRVEPDTAVEVEANVGDERSYIAAATSADTSVGQLVVVVGRGLDDVADSTEILVGLLSVGLPVLLVVMAATTYLVVGRALAPVEGMRREVESITSHDLSRRVPEPDHPDEISRLARTMNRMLGRIEEASDRQRRFVSDAAHELRSPVSSIRQHAEVSLAHPEMGSLTELATTVLEEEQRLERLVEDLIMLARIDERSVEMSEEVDLDDIVFEEANRVRSDAGLRVDTTGVSAGRVLGDANRLRRMVGNLIDNAVRHARSTVSIHLDAAGRETVVLRVDDDGPGIPESERERIFERFVRLDDSRSRLVGGSGLGLAIVAQVATTHGGSVRALASPSGGARLEVVLPLAG